MTFKRWIMHFVDSDHIVGHLADDISTDDRFPAVNEYLAIYNYLVDMNACSNALLAFDKAWQLYEREVLNHE